MVKTDSAAAIVSVKLVLEVPCGPFGAGWSLFDLQRSMIDAANVTALQLVDLAHKNGFKLKLDDISAITLKFTEK